MGAPGLPGSQFPSEDAMVRRIKDLERTVQQFAAANVLATAGIRAGDGGVMVNGFMEYYRADGSLGVRVDPATGTFTAYDAAGTGAVARFGALTETAPGEYGVEVLVGSTWVQLGAQAVTWDLVSGKPGWAADAGSIAGGNISGAVANATEAVHAAQADGSQYGWTNNVAGTEFYALWVGNDGGFHLGRNVSSIKYKENVVDAQIDPAAVLKLRPVNYDRKPTYKHPVDEQGNRLEGPAQKFEGAKNQFGLIAEETIEHVPELITYFGGEIDGINYDLLGVALIPVVKQQAEDIAALKQAVRDLGGNIG
jgi:hypothetical protein